MKNDTEFRIAQQDSISEEPMREIVSEEDFQRFLDSLNWDENPEDTRKQGLETDGYGYYRKDENGDFSLLFAEEGDERSSYRLMDGTVSIAEDALTDRNSLEILTIPPSVRGIPEGALSNSGGWLKNRRGIHTVILEQMPGENSECYFIKKNCFCRKEEDGTTLLLKVLGKDEEFILPKEINRIGKNAFDGCSISKVYLEKYDLSVSFPVSHAFFLEEMLKCFGGNGKLFDFETYDRFLMRSLYTAERVRMLCDRINQPYECSEEILDAFRAHVAHDLKDMLLDLVKENAMETLRYAAETGLFTSENIDEAIEVLNGTDAREMLNYLMHYKNEQIGMDEFDFSI